MNSKCIEDKKIFGIYLSLSVSILIFVSLFEVLDLLEKNRLKKMLDAFNHNQPLVCGVMSSKIIVTQQNGWRLKDDTLIKEDNIIDLKFCSKKD
ncbi:MAG: hypothetical protein U9N30_04325 [Campylobacterota bacterium]|nr:hypothetical protein [Campylobacterota bacterium]